MTNIDNEEIKSENQQIKPENNNLYSIVMVTLGISFIIIICISLFIIFSIIGLTTTSNTNVNNLCYNSNLWYYLLVSLLLFLLTLINYKINNKKENYFNNIILYLILSVGMIIWGTYELYYINCANKLKHTTLYKASVTHWLYNISFLGLNISLFLGIILFSIKFCNKFSK